MGIQSRQRSWLVAQCCASWSAWQFSQTITNNNMGRKRKKAARDVDDATLAGMPLEERAPRKTKAKPAAPVVAPWDAVAAECPCRASADSHHVPVDGIVRAHFMAYMHPVICVPARIVDGRAVPVEMPLTHVYGYSDEWQTPLVSGWRKSEAYNLAEM